MTRATAKLVLIPKVSPDINLDLPSPTAANCGGYILPAAAHSTVYAYSPIDIAVAGVEAIKRGVIVTDLSLFFYRYRNMLISIHSIHLGVATYIDDNIDSITIESIAYWRSVCQNEKLLAGTSGLHAILHKNAPLTFGG